MHATSPAVEIVVPKHRDYTGAKIGMWLFLFSEILLFGGMFVYYAMKRAQFPEGFHLASLKLNVYFGTINTLILLTSSLTVALSITAFQKGYRGLCLFFLTLSILLGSAFLVNKYFEWSAKFHHGYYPGSVLFQEVMAGKNTSLQKSEVTFFNLYYAMTGLHGLHVLVGVLALLWAAWIMAKRPLEREVLEPFRSEKFQEAQLALVKGDQVLWKGPEVGKDTARVTVEIQYFPKENTIRPHDYVLLENVGLYWHLVDVIWIFLFPLFYLVS